MTLDFVRDITGEIVPMYTSLTSLIALRGIPSRDTTTSPDAFLALSLGITISETTLNSRSTMTGTLGLYTVTVAAASSVEIMLINMG